MVLLTGLLVLATGSGGARAEMVVSSSAAGRYITDLAQSHMIHDDIAIVGMTIGITPRFHRAYLTFDLGSISEEIAGLTLTGSVSDLRRVVLGPPDFEYRQMVVMIREVSTPSSEVLAYRTGDNLAVGQAIFNDLGEGTFYSQFTIDNGIPHGNPFPPIVGPNFEVNLSAAAVAAANQSRTGPNHFVLGFHRVDGGTALVGNLSAALRVIPVPEPGGLTLLATASIVLALRARSRRPRTPRAAR
ncbi:hypothetical protein BH23PLA1_BH23PLA1_39880 [soil metagenome]